MCDESNLRAIPPRLAHAVRVLFDELCNAVWDGPAGATSDVVLAEGLPTVPPSDLEDDFLPGRFDGTGDFVPDVPAADNEPSEGPGLLDVDEAPPSPPGMYGDPGARFPFKRGTSRPGGPA